jgi:hypothetical protein
VFVGKRASLTGERFDDPERSLGTAQGQGNDRAYSESAANLRFHAVVAFRIVTAKHHGQTEAFSGDP